VAQTVIQSILDGNLLGGMWSFYSGIMGGYFTILVMLALFVPLFIRPQLAEFTGVAYVLIGYVIQDFLPGDVLAVGRVLMVVGFTAFFVKLWLGRDA